MTIYKFQLDTIYCQLLELRGLTDLVDTKKLSSIDGSMTAIAEELVQEVAACWSGSTG